MKAALITRYGSPDVVKICEVPKPAPEAGEVLIRVRATTVNRTDCGELRPHPFFARLFYGLRLPNRPIFLSRRRISFHNYVMVDASSGT
ncbi:MAG TPA: hypothetical protein VHY79_15225 [Rhizomicrobium sp.]|jgi:hypothetical protein|nr:hypothetical protein [Rhizomicrobium sp.]